VELAAVDCSTPELPDTVNRARKPLLLCVGRLEIIAVV